MFPVLPRRLTAAVAPDAQNAAPTKEPKSEAHRNILKKTSSPGAGAADSAEEAVVAAGCFWGVELAFQRIPGVIESKVARFV